MKTSAEWLVRAIAPNPPVDYKSADDYIDTLPHDLISWILRIQTKKQE